MDITAPSPLRLTRRLTGRRALSRTLGTRGERRAALRARPWTGWAAGALGGALVAGSAFAALQALTPPAYASQALVQVVAEPGTGDPDRVIATELSIITSRTVVDAAARTLGLDPADLVVTAEQLRLSNTVVVATEQASPEEARRATSAVVARYLARTGGGATPQASAALLDRPSAGTPTRVPSRDLPLAALAGALVGAAAVGLRRSLAPLVRDSYDRSPVDAPLAEVPWPGRDEEASAATLRSAVTALAEGLRPGAGFLVTSAGPAGDGLAERAAAALQGEGTGPVRAVVATEQDLLARAGAGDPSRVVVVLARAWADSEAALAKRTATAAALGPVVVVVAGARELALVAAPSGPRAAPSAE